jgi:GNAT superfamily N-acetyltransferase
MLISSSALLGDLVVRETHQKRGIGTELLVRTRNLLPTSARILHLAQPETGPFFQKVGFQRHERGWWFEIDKFPVCFCHLVIDLIHRNARAIMATRSCWKRLKSSTATSLGNSLAACSKTPS